MHAKAAVGFSVCCLRPACLPACLSVDEQRDSGSAEAVKKETITRIRITINARFTRARGTKFCYEKRRSLSRLSYSRLRPPLHLTFISCPIART